jgi:hypothetical protein
MMNLTRERAAEIAAYKPKLLTDDSYILRKETGEDILGDERKVLTVDDALILCGYADLRRAGYPVKLAGAIMSRIRTAMLAAPEADQLMTVTLENGGTFTLDAATLDLTSGYNSGGYIAHAFLFDIRNYRQRVLRAIEAYEPGIEADDAIAA